MKSDEYFVGEEVVCVDGDSATELDEGRIYEIRQILPLGVLIIGSSASYSADRFEKRKYLPGDILSVGMEPIPALPEGYDYWFDRGEGWGSPKGAVWTACRDGKWSIPKKGLMTSAVPHTRYLEAIRHQAEDLKPHQTATEKPERLHATTLLICAADTITHRGEERDKPNGERSMARCVAAFNVMFDLSLTEEQGWRFMELLKMSRSTARGVKDDYLDGAAYAALAGECRLSGKEAQS